MNLHVTGAGPAAPAVTEAEATWIKTLFAVPRTACGSAAQRLALANERNAWAAVQRERMDAVNGCHLGAKTRAR